VLCVSLPVHPFLLICLFWSALIFFSSNTLHLSSKAALLVLFGYLDFPLQLLNPLQFSLIIFLVILNLPSSTSMAPNCDSR
jgi:hypothetical protein